MSRTQGPYSIGPLTQGGPEEHDLHIPIVAGSTIRIADVYARLGTHPEVSPAEALANARLFKAAPELLKVCEQAVQFVAKYTADHESVIGQRILDRMTAAIREARP